MSPLVLTVGNIYIDHNVYGINGGKDSRLEFGKEYAADKGERVLGGSAINAALQMHRLGINVGFIGKTGTDAGGREIRALLDDSGIMQDLIISDATKVTSMSVDIVDNDGEFISIHYGDASKSLTSADIDINHRLYEQTDAVYFGGTAKQTLLFADCANLFKKLTQKEIKIFYDPNRFPAGKEFTDQALLHQQLSFVEGYLPNEEELLQAMSKPTIDEALHSALQTGVRFVALKRGAEGCRIKTADEDFTVGGKAVKAVTTVGAGDCFNAAFIACYLEGNDLRRCAEFATAAAATKVSQNIWPDLTEIQRNI